MRILKFLMHETFLAIGHYDKGKNLYVKVHQYKNVPSFCVNV